MFQTSTLYLFFLAISFSPLFTWKSKNFANTRKKERVWNTKKTRETGMKISLSTFATFVKCKTDLTANYHRALRPQARHVWLFRENEYLNGIPVLWWHEYAAREFYLRKFWSIWHFLSLKRVTQSSFLSFQ